MVFDRRATKHPAKIRAALRVGAAPAPRRVAGSLNRTSAIRLASALPVIRRRSQRCYTSLRLGALERVSEHFQSDLERLKERSIRNNLARCAITLCWDHAGLSHDEIAALFRVPAIRWLRRFGEPKPTTLL